MSQPEQLSEDGPKPEMEDADVVTLKDPGLGGKEKSIRIPKNFVLEKRERPPNPLTDTQVYTKTGKNDVFEASPAIVHFKGYSVGTRSTFKLRAINISSQKQRVHIIPPMTPFFTVRHEKLGSVAPGIAENIFIDFVPTEYRYYYDCIRFHTADENLLVPIHAYPVMKNIGFPKKIEFGTLPVGKRSRRSIPLKNDIPISFEYEVSVLEPDTAFTISPLVGSIPGNGTVNIAIEYQPMSHTTSQSKIRLNISQFGFDPVTCIVCGGAAPKAKGASMATSASRRGLDTSSKGTAASARAPKKVKRRGLSSESEDVESRLASSLSSALGGVMKSAESAVLTEGTGRRARRLRGQKSVDRPPPVPRGGIDESSLPAPRFPSDLGSRGQGFPATVDDGGIAGEEDDESALLAMQSLKAASRKHKLLARTHAGGSGGVIGRTPVAEGGGLLPAQGAETQSLMKLRGPGKHKGRKMKKGAREEEENDARRAFAASAIGTRDAVEAILKQEKDKLTQTQKSLNASIQRTRPVQDELRRKTRDVIVDGISVPTNLNTPAGVMDLLTREPGKMKAADLKAAIQHKRELQSAASLKRAKNKARRNTSTSGSPVSTVVEDEEEEEDDDLLLVTSIHDSPASRGSMSQAPGFETRQMKELAFEHELREKAAYERKKDLKWFECVGESMPTEAELSKIVRRRKKADSRMEETRKHTDRSRLGFETDHLVRTVVALKTEVKAVQAAQERERLKIKQWKAARDQGKLPPITAKPDDMEALEQHIPRFSELANTDVWGARRDALQVFLRGARTVIARRRAALRLARLRGFLSAMGRDPGRIAAVVERQAAALAAQQTGAASAAAMTSMAASAEAGPGPGAGADIAAAGSAPSAAEESGPGTRAPGPEAHDDDPLEDLDAEQLLARLADPTVIMPARVPRFQEHDFRENVLVDIPEIPEFEDWDALPLKVPRHAHLMGYTKDEFSQPGKTVPMFRLGLDETHSAQRPLRTGAESEMGMRAPQGALPELATSATTTTTTSTSAPTLVHDRPAPLPLLAGAIGTAHPLRPFVASSVVPVAGLVIDESRVEAGATYSLRALAQKGYPSAAHGEQIGMASTNALRHMTTISSLHVARGELASEVERAAAAASQPKQDMGGGAGTTLGYVGSAEGSLPKLMVGPRDEDALSDSEEEDESTEFAKTKDISGVRKRVVPKEELCPAPPDRVALTEHFAPKLGEHDIVPPLAPGTLPDTELLGTGSLTLGAEGVGVESGLADKFGKGPAAGGKMAYTTRAKAARRSRGLAQAERVRHAKTLPDALGRANTLLRNKHRAPVQ